MSRRTVLKLFSTVETTGSTLQVEGDPTGRKDLKYVGDVERMSLLPSDRIVLTTEDSLDDESIKSIREQLQQVFGEDRQVVVLCRMKMSVLGPLES